MKLKDILIRKFENTKSIRITLIFDDNSQSSLFLNAPSTVEDVIETFLRSANRLVRMNQVKDSE